VLQGKVGLLPVQLTTYNYKMVFENKALPAAAYISVMRTLLGIIYHVSITGIASYALSFKELPFNKSITIFFMVPMYIGAGLIPTYVNMYELGLVNNFWVYILPHAFGAYVMFIMRTYFSGIPRELNESAMLDGASELTIFLRIILPLSLPIIAVVALYQGVWQWNSWFDAMMYVNKVKLHPLAMLLQRIIRESEATEAMMVGISGSTQVSPQSIRMTMLIVTTLPIVFIYPFFQRYFVKGVMIGAVKG